MRATLRLSSPAWLAQPSTTSSMAAASSRGLRASNAAQRNGGEIIGADCGKRAAVAAEGCADGVANESCGHGYFLEVRWSAGA